MKCFLLSVFLFTVALCQSDSEVKKNSTSLNTTKMPESSTSSVITTSVAPETTTKSIEQICDGSNITCDECISRGSQCYFCRKTKKCSVYPYKHLVPRNDECGSMGDIAWGTCLVNFQTLIITMSVIGGVLIIGIIVCCYCCCRKQGRDKWARQQAKWEKEREERKARAQERKKERQAKTDEIRRKYGLIKDDNPYQRFDT
ncbi:pituitary tumor-transforming gene 1 protein-interacting protein-like isoform X2 [Centruroides vittatus]|uniref:pituitary tumor-transforming gene 1 protein-interacting protein-like isoform X2 n=1 Tax=Centruroides vittatus TaxID=120091 RepID=UPI00350E9FFB